MNAMLTPPPERDLPRHEAIRRQVVQAAAAPRRRPARLLPVATAAGVTLVVGATVAALAGWLGAPAPVGSGNRPTDPGGDNRALVVRQCLGPLPAPTPDPAPMPPSAVGARLLATFSDATGGLALVGNAGGFATCDIGRDGQVAGYPDVSSYLEPWPRRLSSPGQPVSVDLADGRVGLVGRSTSAPNAPFVFEVVGRVAPTVARVTATWSDGHTLTAAVQNGFYAVRQLAPRAGRAEVPLLSVTVRAYDRTGHLLGTAHGTDPLASPAPTGASATSTRPGR
jgi:hypothetical protein